MAFFVERLQQGERSCDARMRCIRCCIPQKHSGFKFLLCFVT